MRIFLYLILTAFFSSCGQNTIQHQSDLQWNIADEAYDNEIGKRVFSQLREKKLYVCESGWDLRGKEKISCMHCGFSYYNEITLEEARKLLVEAISLYLNEINKNERIRPFLNNYPFTLENIEIRIFLSTSKGSTPAPDKLQAITFIQEKLRYKIGLLDSERFRIVICEETFEEALHKLGLTEKTEHFADHEKIGETYTESNKL